jgi:hypothetical protein
VQRDVAERRARLLGHAQHAHELAAQAVVQVLREALSLLERAARLLAFSPSRSRAKAASSAALRSASSASSATFMAAMTRASLRMRSAMIQASEMAKPTHAKRTQGTIA